MVLVKKACVVLLIYLALITFVSCAFTPQQEYINFVADLDLDTRFDLCFNKVEEGKASFYTKSELYTIRQDLGMWTKPCEEAEEANHYYIQCADELLQSIVYYDDGLSEEYKQALAGARESYAEANAVMVTMNAGLENV